MKWDGCPFGSGCWARALARACRLAHVCMARIHSFEAKRNKMAASESSPLHDACLRRSSCPKWSPHVT
ncbi:hypothetical protein SCLCIDRAFT_329653 [Scleroderma citrinum Foug A]|uniref:Uncharacterized protein n=1 Tax=Scleroderma citrinum Foug A TaxID=1036808 RepID=A0A0C3EE06_9AGAM|nr:hypothetical protein SCLCIDRAFT_329653 [Scleroderma citrinum Foug A]